MIKHLKHFPIITFFLLASQYLIGQNLCIELDSITLSRVILKLSGIHENGEFEGPIVVYQLRFINKSDSIMNIYPSTSIFYQQYVCDGVKYSVKAMTFTTILFKSIKKIELKSNESYPLKFSAKLIRETDLIRIYPKGYDYSKEMIKILPTLKLEYTDKHNSLVSSTTKSVGLSPTSFVYTPK